MVSLISRALATRIGFLYTISIFITLRILGNVFETWALLRFADIIFTILIINLIIRKIILKWLAKD